MNENNTHPLTEDRAADLWDKYAGNTVAWDDWYGGSQRALTSLLRAAFDEGCTEWKANAEAAAERAERAEDRLADSVHVDEAARRVEAAREQGWDDAAQHIYNKGWEGVTALRKANPHRPAPELPTEDGAVIVPADGRKFIEQVGDCANYRRLTYDAASGRWIGWDTLNHEADALFPKHITPGTWRAA